MFKIKSAAFTVVMALATLLGAASVAQAQTSIRPAATINDEVITDLDITARVNLALAGSQAANDPTTRQALRSQVLDLLINEALQRQEARRLGINIPAAQVEESLIRIATRGGNSIEQFIAELQSQGALVSTLRQQLAAQLAWQAVVGRRFFSEDIVTDEDIAAIKQQNKRNAGRQERLLSEMYLPITSTASQAQVLATLQRVRGQVESGQNFGLLAQQFSQAPSAIDGGDIGWVAEGSLDPRIEQVLNATEDGGLTQVITVPGGAYLFGKRGSRAIGQRVTGQRARLYQLFLGLPGELDSVQSQQKLARAAAIIQSVEGCDQFASAIQRFGEQGSGDMGYVNLTDLPPDLARVAGGIEIGRVSPPYPVPNGASLFMVCDRQDVETEVSDEELRNILLEQRLSGRASKLLRELRRRAFIDVRR